MADQPFSTEQMQEVFARLSKLEAENERLKSQVARGEKPDDRPEWLKMMISMNLTYRFMYFGVTWVEDEKTGKQVPSKDPRKQPKTVCEVFDRTTGKFVCSEAGPDDASAREAAFRKAVTAEKPLTPAQAATRPSEDEKKQTGKK